MVLGGAFPFIETVRNGSDSRSLAERPLVLDESQLALVMKYLKSVVACCAVKVHEKE